MIPVGKHIDEKMKDKFHKLYFYFLDNNIHYSGMLKISVKASPRTMGVHVHLIKMHTNLILKSIKE